MTLLRQRVYGLCQGYQDLNDHDRLRTDVALQTAVEQDDELASASTLCRWENEASRPAAWVVHQWWVEQFIASHGAPPRELVLVKAEQTDKGRNPRFVVTYLRGEAQALYDEGYCARGEMENRIKEQQWGLFADRTSCHGWWANQWRLLLSGLAYTLLETLRRIGLAGTIRLKLLKIGAVSLRDAPRVARASQQRENNHSRRSCVAPTSIIQ